MMQKKTRIWKIDEQKFIEIDLCDLEAEQISSYLTEEEIYYILCKLFPPSLKNESTE